ncbi:MAG: nickel-dependent lactate racemase [Clostridiaceae bacterium]
MKHMELKNGKSIVKLDLPEENLLHIINPNKFDSMGTEEEIILNALENPIGSRRMKDLIKPNEKVCIVISDITRAWQKMSRYLPYIVDELKAAGVKDENIIFLSATGTHRRQTDEEHRVLLGDKLFGKFTIYDHVSTDKESLKCIGTTTYGNVIYINKKALECDHVIITGSIVYHFLVGWGGGKKSILPGISGYESVMKNHGLSLSPELGKGALPCIKCGNIENNPVYDDMLQAAGMVNPTFMFNDIMGPDGNICAAVAGDYVKAHEKGCSIVDEKDGVYINEKADVVIASAGGFPKDINFYQTIKTVTNSVEALKDGGSLIVLSECSEGLGGDQDVQDMILNYDNQLDREKSLRERYSISKYVGYYMCEMSERFNFILVSGVIDKSLFTKTKVKVVDTLEDALKIAYKDNSSFKTTIMPYAANTLPKLKK